MSQFTLGEEVTWTRPNGTKRTGRVTGVRDPGTIMETKRGDFHSVQIQIRATIPCR